MSVLTRTFGLLPVAAVAAVLVPDPALAQDDDGWRTIEFETTEVTAADVALSPDGEWLIFTMLGHLFRLPVTGGEAEQLTFGPYYDTDVEFSPDGRHLAFVSDRDGSEGNVFVLELATREITQVTQESSAGRPTWSPDGRAIAYLSFVGEARNSPQPWKIGPRPVPTPPALVRRLAWREGGEPETLSAEPRLFRSLFYLPDGRLGWTVIERGSASVRWDFSPDAITRIELLDPEGTVSTLRTLVGYVDPVSASPSGGLYARRSAGVWAAPRPPSRDDLTFVPLPQGPERRIVELSRHRGWTPRFAVAPNNESVYLADSGQLWKVATTNGVRERIPFSARVRLEIYDPGPVEKPTLTPPGSPAPPRSVLYPVVSPDGRTLVFGAAGYLWQQPLDGGPARRLFEGNGFEEWPAFSPDGKQLAYTHTEGGISEVRVLDFATGRARTLGPGEWPPSWSPDGKRLVFGDYEGDTYHVVALNLSDGAKETLIAFDTWRSPRPHLSVDGRALYYSDTRPLARQLDENATGLGGLYRLFLTEQALPQAVTDLQDRLIDGLVSPTGEWLAFQRNMEIWVAPLGTEPVREEDIRQLTRQGAATFSFTPDGSAVVYSSGNRVWRQALTGGEPEEIPIRLQLTPITAPPLLVRRARVLDFNAGGFSPETSLLIEQGRIRWVGDELGQELPQDVDILDAGGRFMIPGLFDMHGHGGRFLGGEEVYLAFGITSVRSFGGWLNATTDRGETSADPVPRYFRSGASFGGSLGIHDEAEALTFVRRWKQLGANHIKIHNTTSWPLMRAVAHEARRLGLAVVGHGTTVDEVTKSVTAGFTSIEHVIAPSRAYDDVILMLAAADTWWDPTLGAAARGLGDWEEQLAGVHAAYQSGVKLLAGTDLGPEQLHEELGFLVEAGIQPIDVLRIATQGAAEAVGAEDHLGTLEVGKLADIVLLDANPLEDIKNTQTIWRVIKGGWVFDPEELQPPRN
ncbi:MAG: PD40 domain-containing protein [Gemmatimonadetes bacterium]|nr:PD40 domain-containing protein [Gemmatimonadota bacterium]